MKKLFLLLPVVLFLGACGSNATNTNEENTSESAVQSSESLESNQNQETEDIGKSLIVCYSLTENTKAVAEEIQKQVNGELMQIETVEQYPEVYDEFILSLPVAAVLLMNLWNVTENYWINQRLVKD